MNAKTPEQIKPHAADYQPCIWRDYTMAELGQWVHLLTKRAGHRTDPAKAKKDLQDAKNYHAMMLSHIEALEELLA